MLCYLLTIGAHHRQNCWYQLCNNGDISLLAWTLPKIRITSKKASNKSCLKLNFIQKSPGAHMSISPWSGARGLERLASSNYYSEGKQKITFNLGLNAAKNTHGIKKKLQIKVVQNWISYKKVRECMCLSPPGVELWGSRDTHLWKIIMYKNGEVDSVWAPMPPKIHIASKKL